MDFCAPTSWPIATLYNYYANENQRYVVKTLTKMFHNIKKEREASRTEICIHIEVVSRFIDDLFGRMSDERRHVWCVAM